jgi:two-component system, NtrC family, nitrogen regulation sensor histidine kinase NtrY
MNDKRAIIGQHPAVQDSALDPTSAPVSSFRLPPSAFRTQAARRASSRQKSLSHESRVFLLALLAGLPGVAVALVLLWGGGYSAKVEWTLTLLVVGCWLGFAFAARERVVRPLQTISNLLAALYEEDYSVRGRGASHEDALGEVMVEVNALSDLLREQRVGAMEATALLRAVMAEIEVAVFAFDADERLQLVNRAGERLLAQPAERLLGRGADELGLAECLHGGAQTMTLGFPGSGPGGVGRWSVRHGSFREHGKPHRLLVLSDLSQALREEERQAWQRLVRVLGHELNNSLTPIKSIAGSLSSLLARTPRPEDWEEDTRRGLDVIGTRAEALSRFMSAYAKLARLPQPKFQPVDVSALVARVVKLETRLPVAVRPGPAVAIQADGDQLEQLLINLLRNAVEATLEAGGSAVTVAWEKSRFLEIVVADEGPGLPNSANLFVPFFTTKPGGSGIGLVLSRQIAEAHGGHLTLENKRAGAGCEARLRLPL